jgi:D-alanine-D-alanine ligase
MPIQKTRVAILRGGPSPEYEVSLKTGANLLSLLSQDEEKYEPVDIFIDKQGVWHYRGLPTEPHKALRYIDVAVNAMHGAYGEDGRVQKILESHKTPYTGSDVLSSALAMSKDMAKKVYKRHGIRTPEYEVLKNEPELEEKLVEIFRNFLHPVIVKPAAGGSSIGTKLAHTWEELRESVKSAFEHSERVLVEEFVRGKEATCGVIESFRDEKLYALMPIEIVKDKNSIFGFDEKYSGKAEENCPGSFTKEENKLIEAAAKNAHTALGLRHYSRTDMIITPRGNVYVLETNSLPGLTKESLFPKALKALGIKEKQFLDHLIELARKK